MRIARAVELTEADRLGLQKMARGRSTAAKVVLRAKIVLLAAQGKRNEDIAIELATSVPTVSLWRKRFIEQGIGGIEKDASRPGRPRKDRREIERRILQKTTQSKPKNATHWSTRTLAAELGVDHVLVHRVWAAHGLQPHRVRTFKLSNDPAFAEKVRDVVGLYLNPPEHALVFSVDEKSQIQALDRTQPGLPIKKGRCGTMTHDYKRNGTTTLFAAMEIVEGNIIAECMPRHRHREWIRFLNRIDRTSASCFDIHLIADNYATHKHPKVQRWLERHPRFHMHFIPTSSSWLNIIERFFRDLTTKRLRRGSFASVAELQTAIHDYIDHHNRTAMPFVWTAEADKIIDKVGRARLAFDNERSS
ncbi:MAG TPA: IS630 family transposase [Thermoanaerobaculia bacterium]|nr:IS630 family transposase [Thermoanaerobaculia bacterium]